MKTVNCSANGKVLGQTTSIITALAGTLMTTFTTSHYHLECRSAVFRLTEVMKMALFLVPGQKLVRPMALSIFSYLAINCKWVATCKLNPIDPLAMQLFSIIRVSDRT